MSFRIAGIASAVALALVSGAVGLAGTGQAAETGWAGRGANVSDPSRSRPITLGVGQSRIIDLPQDAAEIFVGNPAVANAVVRSSRKIYVMAVANGQTSIFALDKDGRQIISFEINVGRDIDELRRILKTALPHADVVVNTVKDTVILTGTVDSTADAQKAIDIANAFVGQSYVGPSGAAAGGSNSTSISVGGGGQVVSGSVINSLTVRAKDQVMLKVAVVEVRRDVLKELGISSTGTWSSGSFAFDTQALTLNGAVTQFSNTFGHGKSSFTPTLQALERYGIAHIIAEPTVTAISGESAKFTAGGEIPVPSAETCAPTLLTSLTCTIGIQFKQYGVTLNFTPVVLSEGRILLHLATEVTEIDQDKFFSFQTITVNGFRTRKNETSVELPSGGSVVSAGLLQTTGRQVIAGLPGIMNLPILGALFRSRDYQREETELMIVVTPYIARTLNPEEVARPDDGFTDASDPQGWFLGRVNRLYASPSNPQALQNFKGKVGFIND